MRFVTRRDDPDGFDRADRRMKGSWPRFMIEGRHKHGRYWCPMHELYPEFQFALYDGEEACGTGNSIPLHLRDPDRPPSGWGAAIRRGVLGHPSRTANNVLCAISATIAPGRSGRGLGRELITCMKELARTAGLPRLIAPVRPNGKARYPLSPFARYVTWKNPAGEPFDPWLRTHRRCGARFGPVAMRSMHYYGTVHEWESWTGLCFPETGRYVVEGALVPVKIDVDRDTGTYVEPNQWMIHDL